MTRVEPEMYVPPLPGAAVARATGDEREAALYFDEMGDQRVPVGFGRDGQPVYVNFEFVDGTRGAHVSISGVSGIATKTSFAMFLLHSITNCGVLRGRGAQHQGADLLRQGRGPAVPRLRQQPARRRASGSATARSGCQPTPFGNVRVFAPPRRGDPSGTPDVSARDRAVSPFYWTLAEFCEDELLPFVFADSEDERAQYTMLIAQVAARLRARRGPGRRRRRGQGARRRPGQRHDHPHASATWSTLLEAELGDEGQRGQWVAGSRGHRQRQRAAAPAALGGQAAVRASSAATSAHRGERSITTSRAQVTVVDLHNLPDRAQRFVVGVTLRRRVRPQGAAGHRPAADVRRARRAEQVRAARGRQPDQADPARRGRARPVARRDPDRRAADRERGRAAHPGQLRDPGRRAPRRGRGRAARVRLPAARRSGSARRWPSRARCSSPSPTSRCRSRSTSRSRPGRRARARRASGPDTTPARPRRPTRSPPSPGARRRPAPVLSTGRNVRPWW